MTRFIRIKEVTLVTGRTRGRIYADMAEKKFPAAVKIGDRAVAWIEAEVDDWIAARIAARDADSGASA